LNKQDVFKFLISSFDFTQIKIKKERKNLIICTVNGQESLWAKWSQEFVLYG
jgi:hypothetical protein